MADLSILTNRLGPAPVWVWVLGGGVVGGVGLRILRSRSSASTAAAPAVTDTQTADSGGYTPDASGYYADSGSAGGTSGGSTGATSGGVTGGDFGGSTLGTPSDGFGTSASPAAPAPPPDGYAYDANGQLQPKDVVQAAEIFGFYDDLAAGGYTFQNGQVVPIASPTPASPTATTTPPDAPYSPPQAPAAAPAPADTAAPYVPPPPVVTPSPAVAAPTTSPTAHTTPTSGTLLWKGTVSPNLATIAQRWGLPISGLRVTRSGPNTGNLYVVTVA